MSEFTTDVFTVHVFTEKNSPNPDMDFYSTSYPEMDMASRWLQATMSEIAKRMFLDPTIVVFARGGKLVASSDFGYVSDELRALVDKEFPRRRK